MFKIVCLLEGNEVFTDVNFRNVINVQLRH